MRNFIILLCLSSCGEKTPNRISRTLGEDVPRPPVNLSVRNEVRGLIERCAAQMTVDRFRVNQVIPGSENGPYIWTKYTIRRGNSNYPIIIDLNIFAIYEDPAVIPRLQAMIPGVESFFGRYGIKINLNFQFSDHIDYGEVVVTDKTIRMLISYGETHMELWRFPPEPGDSYFLTIVHELGHALGLADEYGDSRYPNRFIAPERNPESIMAGLAPADYLDFCPRHIRQILEPVCPNL